MANTAEVRDTREFPIPNGISYKLLNVCLFGLTCYQVLRYFIRNRADRTSVKILFAMLWTSEAIYVLTMPLNADRLHKAEDQQESFQRMIWSFVIMFVAGALGELILRGLVCRRIWRVGKRTWLSFLMLITVFAPYTGSKYFSLYLPDILLSGTLCFLLTRQRENVLRLRRVDNMRKAFMYAISVGALPPLCQLISMVSSKAGRGTWLSGRIVLRLYLNAMLATLDASGVDEHVRSTRLSIPRSSVASNTSNRR